MLTWLKKKWGGVVWSFLRILAAIWILVSIFGYFTGIQIGFIIIPFFVAGIWAMQVVALHFKTIADMPKSVMLFSLVYIVTALTAYTVGKHTLLGAYEDWAVFERTIFGAIRIFAPYIVLTLGAIYFAIVSPKMKWPRLLVATGMFIMALCLMLHGIVEACDKWTAVYLEKTAQTIEANRLDVMSGLGLMARPKNDDVKVYEQDPATLFFEATSTLDSAIRYPYMEKEGEQLDGMHMLICVLLPDKNGEFTRKSPVGWAQNDEVAVEPRSSEKFHIKKISKKLWEVSFYTDEPVRVMDVWSAGTTIYFSGPTEGEVILQLDPAGGGGMFPLPVGYPITRHVDSPLVLQYRAGGKKIFLNFN